MKTQNLQLYVWTDFCPDYYGGLAFAIAESEEEAKKLIVKERGIEVYTWGDLKIYSLKEKIAQSVSEGN